MADLETAKITSITTAPSEALVLVKADEQPSFPEEAAEIDVVVVKFVLDSVIDLLEGLVLQGPALKHAGQILRDVEDLRKSLSK